MIGGTKLDWESLVALLDSGTLDTDTRGSLIEVGSCDSDGRLGDSLTELVIGVSEVLVD